MYGPDVVVVVVVLQAGMIRTDSDEYFIEPLERGTQELEDQGRVHVVYRRSALLQAPSDISVDYQLEGRRTRCRAHAVFSVHLMLHPGRCDQ